MTTAFTLALAQMNPTVGDLAGNRAKMLEIAARAADLGADIVLYPEMALVGYPPEDLVLVPAFREAAMAAARSLAEATRKLPCDLLFGSLWHDGTHLYNASLLASQGQLSVVREKHDLPNYGVFDEKRVFDVGAAPKVIDWRGVKLGILICEEVWDVESARQLAAQGAEILLVQNASPYHIGKAGQRKKVVNAAAQTSGLPLVYLNLVGGQDELVFDGRSYAVDPTGRDVARLPAFAEALGILKWEMHDHGAAGEPLPWERQRGLTSASEFSRSGEGNYSLAATRPHPDVQPNAPSECLGSSDLSQGRGKPAVWSCTSAPMLEISTDEQTIYHALVLGLRDYVGKNNFPGVVLGLSGGIDSGLSAAIAVDALGPEKVHTIRLPSPFTSQDSMQDAEQLAAALGLRMDNVPIIPLMDAARQTLAPIFAGRHADTTEENIQARLRGLILMGVSNKFGPMVLTTGNKSEMSVGYATLYGDMCGGFSVLKDVYKTTVTKLSLWRNTPDAAKLQSLGLFGAAGVVIPPRMIEKPPTAELRANQRDDDSLPPYAVLDTILRGLVERQKSVAELVAEGMDKTTVERVARLLAGAEYKRRQSAPGVKITPMAFGRDRRWPITNTWKFA